MKQIIFFAVAISLTCTTATMQAQNALSPGGSTLLHMIELGDTVLEGTQTKSELQALSGFTPDEIEWSGPASAATKAGSFLRNLCQAVPAVRSFYNPDNKTAFSAGALAGIIHLLTRILHIAHQWKTSDDLRLTKEQVHDLILYNRRHPYDHNLAKHKQNIMHLVYLRGLVRVLGQQVLTDTINDPNLPNNPGLIAFNLTGTLLSLISIGIRHKMRQAFAHMKEKIETWKQTKPKEYANQQKLYAQMAWYF